MTKEYNSPKHCGKWTELKFMIYDGGFGDTGAYIFFQCKKCGKILKKRIKDSRSGEDD